MLVEEAFKLAEKAKAKNVKVRLLGAVAFRIHCSENVGLLDAMDRKLTDLDFVGFSRERNMIESLFAENGYSVQEGSFMDAAFSGNRLIYERRDGSVHVDVFLDRLEMNHTLDFRNRLDLDYPTMPIADLIMAKLQIHEITDKDMKDLTVAFREHELGKDDREKINDQYITGVLADDWGFYYTVATNLEKCVKMMLSREGLSADDRSIATSRMKSLLSRIEEHPKSTRWKLRARIGTKKKWYTEVESVQREE